MPKELFCDRKDNPLTMPGEAPYLESLTPAAAAALDQIMPSLVGSARSGRLIELAMALHARGFPADAARLCLQALEEAPADAEIAARAQQVLSIGVPRWHVPMLHDRARAEAYDRAIRRAVQPGMVVLDIGTGSGLLAMMAARAGAELVVACEQHPALALLAERNIQRNGLADRIRVVPMHSTKLAAGAELPRRADLVVSEIVSIDLLSEGIVAALEHARTHLLTERAPAIPAAGSIHVALGEGSPGSRAPAASIAGFDLSAINLAMRPLQLLAPPSEVRAVSDETEMFSFDFSGRGRLAGSRVERVLTADRDASVTGVVQWMRLALDAEETLSTALGSGVTTWDRAFFHANPPIDVRTGDRVRVTGASTRRSVIIWLPDRGPSDDKTSPTR